MRKQFSRQEKFRLLLSQNTRFDREAYIFIFHVLYLIVKREGNGYIPARELLDIIRTYAIGEFACLAFTVFEQWGVKTTDDIGTIVRELIDADATKIKTKYRKASFENIFDLKTAFSIVSLYTYSPKTKMFDIDYQIPCLTKRTQRTFSKHRRKL